MKHIIYIVALCFLFACQTGKDEFIYLNLSSSTTLTHPETIIAFKDKYPVSVKIKDSLAYIIQIKADTALMILDINKKTIIGSIGRIGYGPDDLINPNFIFTIENDIPDIILDEGNLKKIVKIEKGTSQERFELRDYIEYPDPLYISSEINFSKNYIAGRKVGMKEGKMFYIYNRNDKSIIEMDYYPKIGSSLSDPNYSFAPCIALNEEKNRLITGMYFFDMFHLYDLTGKRLNTFCFSKECIPKIDKKNQILDLNDGYSGIVRIYPTSDYCYLFRITFNPITGNTTKILVKIDWEGQLINSYLISDNVSGQFYIDEHTQKFYTIRNLLDSEGYEVFEIVAYKLEEFTNL